MTCADFETLLDEQFATNGLREHPDLAEHAVACSACRASWERYRLLAEGIGAWRDQTPDVDLTAAVIARLEQSAPSAAAAQRSLPRAAIASAEPQPLSAAVLQPATGILDRRRRSLIAAVAALSVLIAVVSLFPALRNAGRPANSIAPTDLSSTDAPRAATARRGRDQQIAHRQDVGVAEQSPYAGLVQLAFGAWDEVSLLVNPQGDSSTDPQRPRPSDSGDGWIDGLQHQLKPIGRGLDNAFDFLWQAGESADG